MAFACFRRLRWVHLAPPLLLLGCLVSMYVLGGMLAKEVRDTAAHGSTQELELSLPSSFDDARNLSLSLSQHLRSHPQSRMLVVLLFASVYILKQTFSIPGSALLNVMAGFVFGVGPGEPLVAFLTATGASGCYFLSGLLGAELLACAPASLRARVTKLQRLIAREKASGSLFSYLLVLRVFPFTPNFALNVAAPLVGVPFSTFFLTAALGLGPYVYITCMAGDTLRTLTEMQQQAGAAGGAAATKMSLADVLDGAAMAKLALLALCLLIPSVLKRWKAGGDAAAGLDDAEVAVADDAGTAVAAAQSDKKLK